MKIFIITTNTKLAGDMTRAFAAAFTSAGISSVVLPSCAGFFSQERRDAGLLFLDLDCLGRERLPELKIFLDRIRGVPVIAMCEKAKTTNRETAQILYCGVNDVVSTPIDMGLLVAKTRAHLRRGDQNDRAAKNWCR